MEKKVPVPVPARILLRSGVSGVLLPICGTSVRGRSLLGALGATAGVCVAAGCGALGPPAPGPTPAAPVDRGPAVLTPGPGPSIGDPQVGRQLLIDKGCGGCHTVRGVPGASGLVGPNLTNVGLRPTLAGESIPNSPEMMERWLLDPAALKPGALMPSLGLTPTEARDLTAFLFSQPYTPQR